MSFVSRLPYRVLVAAGLVLAGIALAPGRAVASCGSYVTIQAADQASPSQPAPLPAVPCHGPGCSKAPAAPVPMTAPVRSTSGSEQPTAAIDSSPSPPAPSGWGRFQAADAQPVRLTPSIFHPPRAS